MMTDRPKLESYSDQAIFLLGCCEYTLRLTSTKINRNGNRKFLIIQVLTYCATATPTATPTTTTASATTSTATATATTKRE